MRLTCPIASKNWVRSMAMVCALTFSPAVFGQVEKLLRDYQNPDPVQRMQALIAASQLSGGDVASLCVPALSDASAAVRYWSAKAVAEVADRGGARSPYSKAQQQSLLEALTAQLPAEESALVAQQMYRALLSLQIPEARPAMIKTMDQRLSRHVGKINDEIRAEVGGMIMLAKAIVTDHFDAKNVGVELRQAVPVMGKYLLLIATGLKDSKLSDELKPSATSAIAATEQIFTIAVEKFVKPKPENLQSLKAPAEENDYLKLLLNTLSWVGDDGVLINQKIVEKPEQLKLPAPQAP